MAWLSHLRARRTRRTLPSAIHHWLALRRALFVGGAQAKTRSCCLMSLPAILVDGGLPDIPEDVTVNDVLPH